MPQKVNKSRKSHKSHTRKVRRNKRTRSKRTVGSSMVVARQTKGKRYPLLRKQHTYRLIGGRTLVTSGNKLTWGQVDQFGLFPEVNTRHYPNSFTPSWNSDSPYPASL